MVCLNYQKKNKRKRICSIFWGNLGIWEKNYPKSISSIILYTIFLYKKDLNNRVIKMSRYLKTFYINIGKFAKKKIDSHFSQHQSEIQNPDVLMHSCFFRHAFSTIMCTLPSLYFNFYLTKLCMR